MAKKKTSKIPVEAVQELADKAPEAASIGGTQDSKETSEDTIEVDINLLRSQVIHCVMPCFDGLVTESTFMSFMKFSSVARQLGLNWSIDTIVNESLVTRARNSLVAKFMARSESTHLMFVDADIGWEPWQLLSLANRNLDVVSGLYPMKTLPIKWVVNSVPGAEKTPDGLQQVSTVGCGFLLVKRDVFTKLRAHPRVQSYVNDIGLDADSGKNLYTYFDTELRDGRYLSEDWNFSKNWTDLGNKLWVDTRVLLRHVGRYQFSLDSQTQLVNSYGPIYAQIMEQKGLINVVGTAKEPVAKSPSVNKTIEIESAPVAKSEPAKSEPSTVSTEVVDFESTADIVSEPKVRVDKKEEKKADKKVVEPPKIEAKKSAKKSKSTLVEQAIESAVSKKPAATAATVDADDGGTY